MFQFKKTTKRLIRDFNRYKWWQRILIGYAWIFYPIFVTFLDPNISDDTNIWET